MQPLDGINVVMAMEVETVIANIARNSAKGLPDIFDLPEWRELRPIALVGGGPSLNETADEIRSFKDIMACGSVHDHLVGLGIAPRWTVVSDPDPVMAEYLRRPVASCTYLVASCCDEAVFKALEGQNIVLWHCGESTLSKEIWGDPKKVLGGGCTVGTRAVIIALSFGFREIHFFGFDNCIRPDAHHAYSFATEAEELDEITPIRIGGLDSPEFLMAGYMVGQLFDFKNMFRCFAHRMRVTVHGDGALAYLVKFGQEQLEQRKSENAYEG